MQYHRQHWLNQHLAVQTVLSNSVHGVSGTRTHKPQLCDAKRWIESIYSFLFSQQRRCQPRVDYSQAVVDSCSFHYRVGRGKADMGLGHSDWPISCLCNSTAQQWSKLQVTMQHVLTGEMLLALARQMLLHFSYEVYAAGMTALRLCPALQSNIVKWCQTQNRESSHVFLWGGVVQEIHNCRKDSATQESTTRLLAK